MILRHYKIWRYNSIAIVSTQPKIYCSRRAFNWQSIRKKKTVQEVEFVSTIFITAKSYGGVRLILNLKRLTEFVKYEHF